MYVIFKFQDQVLSLRFKDNQNMKDIIQCKYYAKLFGMPSIMLTTGV